LAFVGAISEVAALSFILSVNSQNTGNFETEDVTDQWAFVPLVVTRLPCPVKEVHTGHLLLDRELVFRRKIMNMLN
jgi:hypothetical protein